MEGVARRILEPEYLNRGNVRYWPKADIVYEEVTDKLSLSGFLTSAYLAFEAENGCRPSTVSRRCAAIRYAHKLAGKESPTASEAVKQPVVGRIGATMQPVRNSRHK
jgi:hypothetical protein